MLDVKTAFLLRITQTGTFSILLLAIWLHAPNQRHYLWFGLGFAGHALGLGLIATRNEIPDFISIQVANFISLSSFSFWVVGLARFDGRQPPRLFLLPALLWTAANLLPFVRAEFAYRFATYEIATSVGFVIMAFTVGKSAFSTIRYRQMLATVWILQAISGIVFAGLVIMLMPGGFPELTIKAHIGLVAIVGFVTAVVILAKMLMDQSEARLRELACTDPLTGALNRRGLSDAFEDMMRAGEKPAIALLLFDLDHFKQVNDRYGHQTGDLVLCEFARLCKSLLPQGTAFGRTGGEEFAAVLTVAEARDAALIAETARLAMAERKIPAGAVATSVTVSIGIAVATMAEATLDQLIKNADKALYRAKAQGRNRTAVTNGKRVVTMPLNRTDPLDDQADRQVAILKRLASAAGSDKS
ncbi:GGDEF domain-containing protein [Rhizobium sp. SL42]|uniref:GGDEF domain-containing protein n=1 Tax=Rhizobium sp. SL42 TaxID=2806346 RepID=UPI001F15CDEA|nr:GGDEF domain-containing protein [Rhizobium sp. SL42]UJW73302.1 GGDEF domain-containing protein [Rhizobium sp. SL42]